jgi:ribosome biogenesis protein BMS1
MEEFAKQTRKQHRKPSAGPSADKKKAKKDGKGKGKGQVDKATEKERKRNPKAFGAQSTASSARQANHKLEKMERKLHVPLTDRSYLADDPAPVVVAVVGPPSVGKTTLIRSLVKHYTKHSLNAINGPVTVVSSAKQRLTFIDTPCDVPAMMDAAKGVWLLLPCPLLYCTHASAVADLVLLLIDAAFGFEMETFEFLNILQVHGFPKVMGVLTHLDSFKVNKKLRRTKKILKHRFWTDVYATCASHYENM